VWGQAAQKINLVKGNRKIHPAFGNWSLPAPETCLRAWQCLGFCYTFKVLKGLRGKVKAAWRENLRASLRRDFTDLMVARILDVGLIGVRVHESGDFHTKSYVLAWAEIARRLPAVRFWYYTKSHAALDLSPLTALPNFTVTKSEGGLDDDKIDKATDNYAVVVDEPSQAKAGEYVCPADLPGVKLTGRKEDTWCGNKCDYCLPPRKERPPGQGRLRDAKRRLERSDTIGRQAAASTRSRRRNRPDKTFTRPHTRLGSSASKARQVPRRIPEIFREETPHFAGQSYAGAAPVRRNGRVRTANRPENNPSTG